MKNGLFTKICISFLVLFLSNTFVSYAQEEHAWVFFNSKANVDFHIANPLSMLTQRSIDRRVEQGIAINYSDVPVAPNHIEALENNPEISFKIASKWMNAAHVIGTEEAVRALESLNFVDHIEFADDNLNTPVLQARAEVNTSNFSDHQQKLALTMVDFDYGTALNQIEMFNGNLLHEMNYTGSGKQIAVIDAGFPSVNVNPGFQRLRDNNQILGGYNFVNNTTDIYTGNYHGTVVLSTIGGFLEDEYVGTAPDASFYLYITEDADNETPLEESLWVAAAEEADRVGVDIINSSLGYYTFDDTRYDYDYNTDLDGVTSFISRGATKAFEKGIIMVTSAGNYGNVPAWGGRITAPADVETSLTVGAVNASGNYVSFSSKGPTSNGLIKPDVVAQGSSAKVINVNGNVVSINGTSFSSPIMAGGVACLWQAYPTLTNQEIVTLVKNSASNHNTPNNMIGHGIPNLYQVLSTVIPIKSQINLYPNPTSDKFKLGLNTGELFYDVLIYSSTGRKIKELYNHNANEYIDISELPTGVYFGKVKTTKDVYIIKFLKK